MNSFFVRLKNHINNSLQKLFKPIIWKYGELNTIQEQIDSLYFILNNNLDICKFPKATGALRQTQLVDTEMLRLFDKICSDNNLEYWLDFGTLLGAVRHKGFIPWDDDLDVTMPREDYMQLMDIIVQQANKYGFSANNSFDRMIMSYWDAGANLDIYPIDRVNTSSIPDNNDFHKRIDEFSKYIKKEKMNNRLEYHQLEQERTRIVGTPGSKENSYFYYGPECADPLNGFKYNTIYPLRKISFENYLFNAPNDLNAYLSEIYGDYMSFPRAGILHHKGGGGTPIYLNSKKKNVNMEELLSVLRSK